MAYNAQVLRLLIASPSDCSEERKIVPEVLQAWNSLHGYDLKTNLLPLRWEDDVYPSLELERPQEIINKQIVRFADILVGFFWTKLGTDTGKAQSGTAEEINEFLEAGKPVLLYFSARPVQMASVKREQYDALALFKTEMQKKGITRDFENSYELREMLSRDIHRTVQGRFRNDSVVLAGRSEALHASDIISDEDIHLSDLEIKTYSVEIAKNALMSLVKRSLLDWRMEKETAQTIDQGKAILEGLSQSLFEWRLAYDTAVTEATVSDVDSILLKLKSLRHHHLYLDGGASWHAFWNLGDNAFSLLDKTIERIATEEVDTALGHVAKELLTEIDAHSDPAEKGITLIDKSDLGPGMGTYFPFLYNLFLHPGEREAPIIALGPFRKIIKELEAKRYLEEAEDDGHMITYSRTRKPIPAD